jgi:hypothetical protein
MDVAEAITRSVIEIDDLVVIAYVDFTCRDGVTGFSELGLRSIKSRSLNISKHEVHTGRTELLGQL